MLTYLVTVHNAIQSAIDYVWLRYVYDIERQRMHEQSKYDWSVAKPWLLEGYFDEILNAKMSVMHIMSFLEPYRSILKRQQYLLLLTFAFWCFNSRRVYHLDYNIQEGLTHTSMGTFTWGDLKFPFPSFMITLASPEECQIADHSYSYSTMLMAHLPVELYRDVNIESLRSLIRGPEDFLSLLVDACKDVETEGSFVLFVFGNQFDSYQKIPQDLKERFRRFKPTHSTIFAEECIFYNDQYMSACSGLRRVTLPMLTLKKCKLTDSIIDAENQTSACVEDMVMSSSSSATLKLDRVPFDSPDGEFQDFRERFMHYIAKVTLMLTCFPNSPLYTTVSPPTRKQRIQRQAPKVHKAVVQGTQLCSLQAHMELSRPTYRNRNAPSASYSQGSLKPTFRKGVFRRKWGQGDNPNAPRCVWQPPSLANAHKLGPGEVPEGAEHTFGSWKTHPAELVAACIDPTKLLAK